MLEGFSDTFSHKKNIKKEAILQKYGLEKGMIALNPHHLEEICYYDGLREYLGTEAYRSMFAMRKISLANQGYPEEYVNNYGSIVEEFHKNSNLMIAIVTGYDSMCAHCDKDLPLCDTDNFVGIDAEIALEYNLEKEEYLAEELKIAFAKTSN